MGLLLRKLSKLLISLFEALVWLEESASLSIWNLLHWNMHWNGQRSDFYVFPARRSRRDGGSSDRRQRLGISGDAEKLNQMIGAWPTDRSSHGRMKEKAADLLRGALGLRESLIRLGKIEEACECMLHEGRQRDRRFTIGEEEEEEFTGEIRFDAVIPRGGQQARRNLVSSRKRIGELKKMIRDSLHRQNLVSISDDDEEKPFTEEISSGEMEPESKQKNVRTPNLIARLMGLEEAPPGEHAPRERAGRRKISDRRRSSFVPDEMDDAGEKGKLLLRDCKESRKSESSLESEGTQIPGAGSPSGERCQLADEPPPAASSEPVRCARMEMERKQRSVTEASPTSSLEKSPSPTLSSAAQTKNRAAADKPRSSASSQDRKQMKKKEAARTSQNQRTVTDRNASEEKKNKRPVAAAGSQVRKTPPAAGKAERKPAPVKNRTLRQKSTLPREDHRSEAPATRDRRIKTAKPVATKPISVRQAEAPRPKQGKIITVDGEEDASPTSCSSPTGKKIVASVAGDSPAEFGRRGNKPELPPAGAHAGRKPGFQPEALPKRSHGSGRRDAPGATTNGGRTAPDPAETSGAIRSLLLPGSPSFLRRSQELFHLHHRQPAAAGKKAADDSKLLLDCAVELLAYKHHRSALADHPLRRHCSGSRRVSSISVNWRAEEISEEIKKLYRGGSAGTAGAAGIGHLAVVERDLLEHGGICAADGPWGAGWREPIPVEEGDAVVCDLERHILGILVEEVAAAQAS